MVLFARRSQPLPSKLFRKPSIEREIPQYQRGSPALDSGAGSSRSDSPHSHQQYVSARVNSGQYSPSPCPSASSDAPPPLPLPRCSSNPTTPTPVPAMHQLFKRISPATPPARSVALPSQSPARGTSPVSNTSLRPVVPQNGPQAQQQLNQQMQALNLYQSSGEPPPPYPLIASSLSSNYSAAIQNRQSPTQTNSDYRKSPSSGIYSATSAGSPSPITVPPNSMSPHPAIQRPSNAALGSWQRKTHSPIIMQSVKSTQVQKPVLQTAIAPQAPATSPTVGTLPSYATSIQQKAAQQQSVQASPHIAGIPTTSHPKSQGNTPPTTPPVLPPAMSLTNGNATLPPSIGAAVPSSEPPSYASTMAFKAAQQQPRHLPPPPPYTNNNRTNNAVEASLPEPLHNGNGPSVPPLPPTSSSSVKNKQQQSAANGRTGKPAAVLAPSSEKPSTNGDLPSPKNHKKDPSPEEHSNDDNNNNKNAKTSTSSKASDKNGNGEGVEKIKHESPIPERKLVSKEQEEVKDSRIRHYSPQAFKFFMEQHIENVLKSYKQRTFRKNQLEKEMGRINLSEEAQVQMRKMLNQKESNYIRLKRAKMEKSMFTKLKTIGVGAFGEVTLVQKMDTPNYLYAMKTLKKADVLKRNQVAHVKAERDILAEADNEWVVKLYYSFQDRDNLYFVMDYIPGKRRPSTTSASITNQFPVSGGDLMSLLIKMEIFSESLSKFYIAELTCAVESVHKMGFIHRQAKYASGFL